MIALSSSLCVKQSRREPQVRNHLPVRNTVLIGASLSKSQFWLLYDTQPMTKSIAYAIPKTTPKELRPVLLRKNLKKQSLCHTQDDTQEVAPIMSSWVTAFATSIYPRWQSSWVKFAYPRRHPRRLASFSLSNHVGSRIVPRQPTLPAMIPSALICPDPLTVAPWLPPPADSLIISDAPCYWRYATTWHWRWRSLDRPAMPRPRSNLVSRRWRWRGALRICGRKFVHSVSVI